MSQIEYDGTSSDGRQFLFVQHHHVKALPSVFQWMAIDAESGDQYQAKPQGSVDAFEIPELGLRIPVTERQV